MQHARQPNDTTIIEQISIRRRSIKIGKMNKK